jgi:predicted HTH transcriptional regulator
MPLIIENAPDVTFRETAGLFVAEFLRPSFLEPKNEKTRDSSDKTTANPETTQEKILCIMKENPGITRKELSGKIGLTGDGIKYHLKNLKKAGKISMPAPPRLGTGR